MIQALVVHGPGGVLRPRCWRTFTRPIAIGAALLGATFSTIVLVAREMPAGQGLREAGVPPYSITGADAIGLDTPPTDLRLLPDGRVLVVSERQLAIGDGVRWQVFNQAPDDAN